MAVGWRGRRERGRRAGETRGWKTLVLGNVSPLPRGRRALPRRQEPGRCRDATATARTFRTEPRTSNCSRSAPNDVSRRERAEPRSASTAQGITFEKRNTRVCSGYWCPYTGRRESNDRFRGGGGGLRRRGGRRAGGGRARRRGGSRSRSRACASGEGPMGGRRESERSVWRASRSEGSPGRRRVLTSKPWVERF